MSAGLSAAEAEVKQSTKRMAAAGKDALPSGMLGKAGAALAGPWAAVAATAVAATGTIYKALGTIDDLAEQGRLAKALGMSSESFTRISYVANQFGADTKSVLEGLIDMSGRADEALAGGMMADIFKTIGLDAAKFKALSIEEKFYAVADALETVKDPGDRAKATLKIFGEDIGKQLLPVMAQGGAAIRAMGDEAARMGAVVNSQDMSKVTAAQGQIARAGTMLEGAWRKIVVAIAPVIGFVAGVIGRFTPVFDWLSRAATAYYAVMTRVWEGILDGIAWVIEGLADWIGSWTFLGGELPRIETVITTVFKAIGIAGAYAWDVLKAGAGAVVVGMGHVVKAMLSVHEALVTVIRQGSKLPDSLGGAEFRKIADMAEVMNGAIGRSNEKAMNWGRGAMDNFGKSAKDVEAWFAKANQKSDDTAAKAAANSKKLAEAAAKANNYAPNNVLTAGTKEEMSARIRAEFGAAAELDKNLEEAKRQTATLKSVETVGRAILNKMSPALDGLLPI